ncbi:MAG: tetratricopeptide repeat protein [Bacilli bacterium]
MLYQNTNPSQAVEYATQGLDLSQKTGDENGVSICLNSLGTAYYNLGNFDAALDCFEKRFYLTAKIRDTLGIAGSMDNISTVLVHKGELDKALDLRRKSTKST